MISKHWFCSISGKVGFMSRTLEWVRVDKIPAH